MTRLDFFRLENSNANWYLGRAMAFRHAALYAVILKEPLTAAVMRKAMREQALMAVECTRLYLDAQAGQPQQYIEIQPIPLRTAA